MKKIQWYAKITRKKEREKKQDEFEDIVPNRSRSGLLGLCSFLASTFCRSGRMGFIRCLLVLFCKRLLKKTGQQGSRDGYSIIWNKEVVITSLPWRWFFLQKTSRGVSSQLVRLCQPLVCLFFRLKNSSGWNLSDEKNKKQVLSHFFGQKTVVFDFGWLHLLAKIGIHAWFRQSSSPPFTEGWVFPQGFQGWHWFVYSPEYLWLLNPRIFKH